MIPDAHLPLTNAFSKAGLRERIMFVAIAVWWGAAPHPGPSAAATRTATVPENATTTYFDVRGVSAAALRAELTRLGPRENGFPAFGKYYASIRYNYTSRVIAGVCEAAVRVDLTSTTTLPRWIDERSADLTLQRQWKDFLGRLTVHENGHRTIAIATANEMQRTMTGARASSCAVLDSDLKARFNALLARSTADQTRYDADTSHGMKQGAIWPPPQS
jgi:predicted secreted Zn-dependent protease